MQKKRCSQWCIWGCSGPPVSSKMMLPPRREHSFHISTCRSKVLQNCSQWPSFEALWRPKSATSPSKDPQKKQQKINAICVAPRTSKWPRNGLKIDVGFLTIFIFFASLHAYCFQLAPERPKYNFFFKSVPPETTFLPLRLNFLTIVLTFFLCPLSFFDEKQITRKIEKWKQNYTDCEYSTDCFGVRRCHAAGVFNNILKLFRI